MKSHARTGAAAVLMTWIALPLFGCSDAVRPRLGPGAPRSRLAETRPRFPRPPEDLLAAQGSHIPGFGGYSYDRAGNMVVYLTDLSQSAVAQAQLAPVLRAKPRSVMSRGHGPSAALGRTADPKILVRQVRYTFQELRDWRDAVDDQLLTMPGVVMLGIDLKQNQVFVSVTGTRESGAQAQVERVLDAAGVPRAAVAIHFSSRFVSQMRVRRRADLVAESGLPACGTWNHDTNRDYQRPLEAGLMICWVDRVDNIRECTLGFVTVSNGDTSFVTASHCSQTHGALDSTTYFQPNDSVITYYVGSESLDPAFVTDATCPAGPAGCRNSDVTLVKAAAPAALGRMGRPVTCFCPSWGNPPDSASDYLGGQGPYAYFTIQADTIATDEVWMLGAKSGETYGFLVSSCVDATTESGAVIKCQVVASYPSTFGDSGAPVFFWPDTPPYDQYVDLLGVHFGATTDSALGCQGGCGVFSPIAAVKQELGNVPTH